MRLLIFLLAIFPYGLAYAGPSLDQQIKNSYLTLSAFECSAVSPDEKEAERLFLVGLNSGREFIAYANAHKKNYLKDLKPKVAILWNMTGGPSPDFILGQIYADRVEEVYKEFTTDKELWKLKKSNMYHEKNCALLGK